MDSTMTFELYRDEMIRYYSNIVGKYGTPVQSALKKLAGKLESIRQLSGITEQSANF